MPLLTVSNISKAHNDELVLNNISFTQAAGQRMAIAGETGSGKTTLMRIVSGLGQADSGSVYFEGKQVKGIEEKMMPGHKGISYLSQHFELQNKYRVSELLAFANDLTDEASEELYKVCDVQHLMHRWSQTLSGGEKQRVALAKLLTTAPKLLLLDEPYSNLDRIHKEQLKKVIWDVGEQLDITCAIISHEPDDILPWADEVLVMKHGAIVQQGTPQQVYRYPSSAYIAGLFGKYTSPPPALAATLNIAEGTYLRPGDIAVSTDSTKGIPAVVGNILYLGAHYELELNINNELFFTNTRQPYPKDTTVYISIDT